MENYNLKKGLICGILGTFLIGLQPIIAIARPSIIDPYIFAAITALIEAIVFLPIYFFERNRLNKQKRDQTDCAKIESLLNGWKKRVNLKLLLIIAISFSIIPVLLYIGFELAEAINSSLALKSEIIFALLFGYLILKEERISKIQILFCFLLFFGLIIAITQGSFNLLEFNFGVLIIIFTTALFSLIHTITKSAFDRNELFPSQVVFIRNLSSGTILLVVYLSIFPLQNLLMLLDFNNFIFFLVMGLDYGFSLFLWYKTLSYIQIGKAGIINSLTPIISSFFAVLLLGDSFTIFHLIGTTIIIISIIMIFRKKKKKVVSKNF